MTDITGVAGSVARGAPGTNIAPMRRSVKSRRRVYSAIESGVQSSNRPRETFGADDPERVTGSAIAEGCSRPT